MSARKPVIVFVCTGNVCRSPMAEYLLKLRLGGKRNWEILSAGTAAFRGFPASTAGVRVMRELGVDMSRHQSRPADRDLIDSAKVVVVMTASHRDQLRAMFRDVGDRVFLLKSFYPDSCGGDVEDPIGASEDVYREIRDEIDKAMPGLIKFLESMDKWESA